MCPGRRRREPGGRPEPPVRVRLYVAGQIRDVTSEVDYFQGMKTLYNLRNPHAMVGEEADEGEVDFEELPPDEDPHS